jgi:Flp pilus assembly protein protease CpaA
MSTVLLKLCGYTELAAERIIRREVVVGTAIVFVLSLALSSQSEVIGWINTSALVALCLLVILWALDKGLRELLGRS